MGGKGVGDAGRVGQPEKASQPPGPPPTTASSDPGALRVPPVPPLLSLLTPGEHTHLSLGAVGRRVRV